MHELGVVFHIADSLAKIAEENHVARISRVTLQLGEVSTVVPEYLTDVWNWNCKRTPLLTGCALEIERIRDALRRMWTGLSNCSARQALPPLRKRGHMADTG